MKINHSLKKQKIRQLVKTHEVLERIRAKELFQMTEKRAQEIISTLSAVAIWKENSQWSGLVEQQAFFHKLKIS